MVAVAPAVLSAADDRRGAHHRRSPQPRAGPAAPALEAAARRGALQGAARSARRLRRARGARRGRRRSTPSSPPRSARPSTRSGSTARSATPAATSANSSASSATPPASFTRSPTPASSAAGGCVCPGSPPRFRSASTRSARGAATRSATSRTACRSTSTSCGSPSGLILGFADPGGTVERIDPFDPLYPRRVTLVLGPSGGGKTVLMNVLLMRAISQGMRGWIIDRSSTPDQRRSDRRQRPLRHAAVAGPRLAARAGRLERRRRDLPVGRPRPRAGPERESGVPARAARAADRPRARPRRRQRTLTAVEEGLLSTAIDDIYAHCATTGERPRETLLLEQLAARAERGRADRLERGRAAVADPAPGALLRRRDARAHRRPADDRPRRRAADAVRPHRPAGAADPGDDARARLPHRRQRVQHTRRARVAGELDDTGAWAGKLFLVVEEGWALTASPAAGAWLNEYARRSRHYALWLIFISQHFKDLANEQGRALLGNSVLRLCLQNDRDDLDYGRDTIGLTGTDIEQITTLPKQEGLYSTVYVVSRRGRGAVRSLARRPRVLGLLLRPRARPAPPRPSAQRRRR